MGKGIIGQLSFMAVVVFAIPVAMLGVDFLLKGEHLLGAGFLFIAFLMIALEEYATRPTDLVTDTAARVTGRIVKTPDEDGDGESDGEEVVETTSATEK